MTNNLPTASTLVSLLQHQDFVEGIEHGREAFYDNYEKEPLTEDEMMRLVDENLTREVIEKSHHAARVFGWDDMTPFLYHVGFIVSMINEGMTYTQ